MSSNPIIDWLTTTQPPVEWLIPDLLPRGYLITLIADAGAGKSTLSYTLGMALASGVPVLGFTPTTARPVLYFDDENAHPDMIVYLQRAWIGLGRPNLDLLERHLWIEPFTLGKVGWADTVKERVLAVRPALVIFDTAISCCPPRTAKGEDDNAEAIRTINTIRELTRLVGATALILKHAKIFPTAYDPLKEPEYDVRGAKAWKGAADSVLFLAKGKPPTDAAAGHPTRLFPLKSRAFGLHETVAIRPEYLEGRRGLRLHRG